MNDDRKAALYAHDLSAVAWRKASASGGEGNCVEVAQLPGGGTAVRDSKNLSRAPLRFTGSEWAAFLGGIMADEL
ncbi:DUF397 domain-containing protein [Streptomyces sp. NBC_00873]|uniref:DUF397 domain-containing protein n=1 Tax=unclassified Streptomyces TaxID=2593676 RepID=UPI00386D4468|nr:DUF397 domain-containing protein [Streptomyces sp. NBC_00873]WTA43094.1 DUF397 domain-containing protein [Streptomyces sp. NBC_00842]